MINQLYDGKFCCTSMESAVRDNRWMFDYDPDDKEYYMVMVWPFEANHFVFFYCPWCATDIKPKSMKREKAKKCL